MKTLTFNTPALFMMIPEEEDTSILSRSLDNAITYLNRSHMRYQKHHDTDPFDFQSTLHFLTRLHQLTLQLQNTSSPVSLILTRGPQKLDIMPLNDFFEEYPPLESLTLINVLISCLVEYSEADDHSSFRESYKTLISWKNFILEISN